MQRRIDLRLAHLQVLEEAEEEADFVERQADGVSQKGDRDQDLPAELATADDAGDLAVAVARTAVNAIGDQHGPALLQPPNGTGMRELAIAFADAPIAHRP